MAGPPGQAQTDETPAETPLAKAKHLLLKGLGARRVAGWCGVDEYTVYQWLQRGTDENPVPTKHVAKIVAGARAEGLDAPIGVLWPAMRELGGA